MKYLYKSVPVSKTSIRPSITILMHIKDTHKHIGQDYYYQTSIMEYFREKAQNRKLKALQILQLFHDRIPHSYRNQSIDL